MVHDTVSWRPSTAYKSSYTVCGQYSGSVAPSENAVVACALSSQNARFVIVQGSLPAAEAICLAEVSVYASSGGDACSGAPVEYTANSGTIQSPGYAASTYPDNSDCQWRISASPGYVISVTFQELSVEPEPGCPYDSVTLYDGSSTNSPQLGRYCSGNPGTITSSGSSLFIRFTSDYSVHDGRFSLSWSFVAQGGDACGGTPVDYTANSGTIQSPGYATSTYPDNSDCQWRITASPGYVISVTFQELSVEPTAGCPYDSVTLYDGSSTNSPQLGSYCSGNPGTITSSGSPLFIRFTSDHSVHDGRFSLSWSFVSGGGQANCGNPAIEPVVSYTRIVGGVEAREHSWPWHCQVNAEYWVPPPGYCGGSIIDEYHILTAAHCIFDDYGNQVSDASITIICGRHHVSDPSEDITEQKFTGVTATGHGSYSGHCCDFDIAIIRLPRPLTFNSYVQPVCLPSSPVAVGTKCVSTGWGTTLNTGDGNVLRQVVLPIISWNDCNNYYMAEYGGVRDEMLCAGYQAGGKDTCQGDSGGPLVCKQGDMWFQYGVVSWGEGCAKPNYPGIYADVVKFLPFIQQHSGNGKSARMKPEHSTKSPIPKELHNKKPEHRTTKSPIPKELHNKDRSKPPVDPYDAEKELLDLLQRKFADN